MVEIIKDLPDGIYGIEAKGAVTSEDYEKVVRPLLEKAHKEGKRVKFLYRFGPEFESFSAGAAWQDFRVGIQYLRLFERCAIVTDTEWIKKSIGFFRSIFPCPTECFSNEDFNKAVDWLGRPLETNLHYELRYDPGVLIVNLQGPLSVNDFDTIGSLVDPWIESHGKLNGIVIRTKSFPGWENLGGIIRHIQFVQEHHKKVHHVALCSDNKLTELMPHLASHFVKAEIKHFGEDQFEEAVKWAGE